MMINEAQAQATAASGRGDGQYPSGLHDGAEISTAAGGQTKAEVPLTMEAVITRENLMLAYQRVVENKLELKVNEKKSAVARPWERKFLGYSVTWHKQAKLKIALTSVNRLKEKVRSLTTGNRSKSVKATINALTPVLRG
ncbi:hypothetical protein RCV38_15180 [Escherichia coli]|nr:hypothetical protein [Escherichia coli]MCF7465363.1 hypothetical protein [Escherichia coli]MED0527453.1 hypothetical protein [Escherichia coli]